MAWNQSYTWSLRSTETIATPWKDWPQEKRDAAVQLLNNSDWQGLISSMPEGGRLNPGDKVNTPTVIIPGQEEDDPNTPADECLLKKESGFFTFPGGLNTDFDKDGTPDFADPEPQNPNVPTASGGDNSTDQPPDDSLNLPLEQDGPDDQAADAQIEPGDQYLDARAKELASLMDDVARRRRTIAVAQVRNPDGTKEEVVASSNGYLNLAQKNSIDQAEKTRLPDNRINKHAEQKIIEWAEANGKTVESIGASRNICSACWAQMQPRDIRPATHVNLPQTQQ
ncbi:hypothetical protein [Nostoc sp.]|uniref:hypothetical protein n=1 Tax=Nostoc sp. TaxID=1180 RepID=UPI002FFBE2EC